MESLMFFSEYRTKDVSIWYVNDLPGGLTSTCFPSISTLPLSMVFSAILGSAYTSLHLFFPHGVAPMGAGCALAIAG